MKYLTENFTIEETEMPKLRCGQALVRVKCFSLTEEDLDLKLFGIGGRKLGAGFSGDFVKANVTDQKDVPQVGARVLGYAAGGGTMAEYVVCDYEMMAILPPNLSYAEGSAIAQDWLPAIRVLRGTANFEKRNTIVIYNALSPLGQACVRLAQLLGCRRVHCVISEGQDSTYVDKHLKFHTALPDEVITHKHAGDENQTLRRIAPYDRSGVDIVLDLRRDPHVHPEMMRPGGAIVVKPFMSELEIDGQLFGLKKLRLFGIDIRSEGPQFLRDSFAFLVEHFLPKFANGQLSARIDHRFNWYKAKDAIRLLESRRGQPDCRVECIIDETA